MLGDVGGRDGAGCGAEFEVDDAVGLEVAEDGEGGVTEGGEVGDEGVDVGGEEGEEGLEVVVVFAWGHFDQGVGEGGGGGGGGGWLLGPDFVEGLAGDGAGEVGVELGVVC